MDSLQKRTVSGLSCNLVETVANYAIVFVLGIILARLLSPSEFGTIGIISIFITVAESIIDCGFSNSLIRKDKVTNIDYDTLFSFNLVISIILYIVFFFCAPLVSQFFNTNVTSYCRVLGLVIIINSLAIVQRTRLVKDINFKYQAFITTIASLISGSIGVFLAYSGWGVWSLVYQQLSRQFVTCILFWFWGKWRPNGNFSIDSLKYMFGFGWKVMLSGLISTIWAQINTIVIGKVYSKESLGFYSRAHQFTKVFTVDLTSVLRRVTFPALSELNSFGHDIANNLRTIIKILSILSCYGLMYFASISEPFILILLGEKWRQSISFIQILCFSGLPYSMQVINLNVLQVKGRSDYFLYSEIISKVLAVAPLMVGIYIGLFEMLYGYIALCFIMYFVSIYYESKVVNYTFISQLKDVLPSIIVSVLIFTLIKIIPNFSQNYYVIFLFNTLLYFFLAFVFIRVNNKKELKWLLSLIKNSRK